MHFVTMNLKIRAGAIYNATSANQVSSPNVQNLIALLDGKTVESRVYGVTNMCFSVSEKMIRDAWETYEKDNFRLNDKVIDQLVEYFVRPNFSCCLPAFHVENFDAVLEEFKKE
ncbi:hypothetical protein phiAS5_ORF0193 [Aeromonas phage phiAS5]|uniref:Uncharacterized protein n=1 Tax=Aeromonas phage phiAS5 TaxID=879630 RepID=E1A2U0_9CAUD|nr:hypothetical protein phiAS5_ORF0193 [Aeromonas phage phiAS5]ADM80036.1 hypothetical protein phiAS5_ORF0193 [Aeromonas phage phiAS5]BES53194.1 hypothetical protein [Aeromonas phage phiWae14]